METNTSEYIFTAIFSIITKEKKVHLVILYLYTSKVTELNYDIHNKELLTVFKAFYTWHHYLEGSEYPIDVIIDYKNLEYFLTTKILSCY